MNTVCPLPLFMGVVAAVKSTGATQATRSATHLVSHSGVPVLPDLPECGAVFFVVSIGNSYPHFRLLVRSDFYWRDERKLLDLTMVRRAIYAVMCCKRSGTQYSCSISALQSRCCLALVRLQALRLRSICVAAKFRQFNENFVAPHFTHL